MYTIIIACIKLTLLAITLCKLSDQRLKSNCPYRKHKYYFLRRKLINGETCFNSENEGFQVFLYYFLSKSHTLIEWILGTLNKLCGSLKGDQILGWTYKLQALKVLMVTSMPIVYPLEASIIAIEPFGLMV